MGVIERLLRKWGYVRLGRYGLELTPDDRIVLLRPELPAPVTPPRPIAVLVEPPPVAPPPVVEEDEWEWQIAMARARAKSEPEQPKQRPLPGMPPARMAQQMSVARPTPAPVPPKRFARASVPPAPIGDLELELELLEDATIRTLAAPPPAPGDDTSPGLLAPPPVRRARRQL